MWCTPLVIYTTRRVNLAHNVALTSDEDFDQLGDVHADAVGGFAQVAALMAGNGRGNLKASVCGHPDQEIL